MQPDHWFSSETDTLLRKRMICCLASYTLYCTRYSVYSTALRNTSCGRNGTQKISEHRSQLRAIDVLAEADTTVGDTITRCMSNMCVTIQPDDFHFSASRGARLHVSTRHVAIGSWCVHYPANSRRRGPVACQHQRLGGGTRGALPVRWQNARKPPTLQAARVGVVGR